jgi:phosphoenolpyruvate phosphomutase
VLKTHDFLVIARIESLILEKGLDDALSRAQAYVRAGADGIMIHSRKKDPAEVAEFCRRFKAGNPDIPVVAVPTSYNQVTEDELGAMGVDVVIHANHLIRSAFPAMRKTAEAILENGRSLEADEYCMPIREVLTLIPPASE